MIMSLTTENEAILRRLFEQTDIALTRAKLMRRAVEETGLLEGQITNYAGQLGLLKPWETQTAGKVQAFANELKPDAPTPSSVGTI